MARAIQFPGSGPKWPPGSMREPAAERHAGCNLDVLSGGRYSLAAAAPWELPRPLYLRAIDLRPVAP
jgi:hypothetical protein